MRNKAFKLLKTQNMIDIFDWFLSDLATRQLANELHKPIIRNFTKRKVLSPLIDKIWGVGLSDMQLISKFKKGIRFLLYAMIFVLNAHGLFY